MANHLRAGALALALAMLALTARAEPAPITSLQEADAQLAAVAARRAEVEARFGASERACYQRFFVNRCLDQAREARRAGLVGLREIENGAHRFKRAEAVAKRDRLLEEQQRKDVQEAAERVPKAPRVAPPANDAGAGLAPAPHAARTVVSRASAAAEADQRAASVAAFERKQRAAAERQRLVAEKQAKKAGKGVPARNAEAAAAGK